jgi:hypothetical protein
MTGQSNKVMLIPRRVNCTVLIQNIDREESWENRWQAQSSVRHWSAIALTCFDFCNRDYRSRKGVKQNGFGISLCPNLWRPSSQFEMPAEMVRTDGSSRKESPLPWQVHVPATSNHFVCDHLT